MNRILDVTERGLLAAVSAMLLFIVIVTLIQVFFRYVLNNALIWSAELTKLVFIWMTYLGSAVAINRSRHMRVETVVGLLPQRVQQYIDIAMHVLVAGFLVVLMYYSTNVIARTAHILTSALRIPRSILFLPVFIGGAFMLLFCIKVICERVQQLKTVSNSA